MFSIKCRDIESEGVDSPIFLGKFFCAFFDELGVVYFDVASRAHTHKISPCGNGTAGTTTTSPVFVLWSYLSARRVLK